MCRYRSSRGLGSGRGLGVFVLAALFCLLVPSSARAETSVAVLGMEAVNVPEQTAALLTNALRQRVAATSGLRLVAGKDLVEMKLIFGCDGASPACMAQAGRSLGAEKLLYGSLRKAGHQRLAADLQFLDVRTGAIEKTVNEILLRRDLASEAVGGVASRFLLALVEAQSNLVLNISSAPAGAVVTIDGQLVGRAPVALRTLAPGSHTIVFTAPGRLSVTRKMELKASGAYEVAATLEPLVPTESTVAIAPAPVTPPEPGEIAPPPTISAQDEHPGRAAKIIGVTSLAAAVVTGSVAIYTWRVYSGLEDAAHADLKAVAPVAPTAEQARFFEKPGCTPPSGLSGSAVQKYRSDCSSGHTYAAATTGLWVASGALALGGVVSLVVGAQQAAKAKEQRSPQIIRQSLRLAPLFSSQGGGIVASFDF